jgi:glucose-1-phosphate cytidylyltransferase
MKAVLLAGGLGTRFAEETSLRPKPMIEIGGRPILWHIMKIYAANGINDFIICCGYKGYVIKEYFANYFLHMSDVTFDMSANQMTVHSRRAEPWRVTLIDTGDNAMTGGRLLAVSEHLREEDAFCFTYGDGVGNVDIAGSIAFHRSHGKEATMTVAAPPGRFGAVAIDNTRVMQFREKPDGDGAVVNAGFFVLSPKVFNRIASEQTTWEKEPLDGLAADGELHAFKHLGFWQPMDTLRDKQLLEMLWAGGKAPWQVWA